MKRYKGLIIPAAVSLLSACSFDELVSLPQTPEGDGMSISFCSDMMSSVKVGTKASDPKDDAEKQINQLYIFFFGSDGKYLKGGYLSGYDNAPEEGGFYAPGQGVTMLKIANTDEHFADPALAQGATVYAVANVDEALFADGDGDGLPDIIKSKSDLDNYVYKPESGIALGLPENGMPMVGSKTINFTGTAITPEDERVIELKALMARIDVNIKLESDISENNYPQMSLVEWTAMNLPDKVAFNASAEATTGSGWSDWGNGSNPKDITTSLQRTIYNKNGEISFSFYMFENIQAAKPAINWTGIVDPDQIDPETGYPYDVYNPDKGIDYRQRFKPLIGQDTASSAAVRLHAYYSTYNDDGSGSATYEVFYTLYLGSNHLNNFEVKRNHQYKNDITIKGLTRVGTNPEHITFDARVDITEGDNEFYIAMLRERDHDAHFCVTPMDVYMFADKATYNPTIEVILGEMPEGSTDPSAALNVPDWIRMERIPAANMADGSVPDGLSSTNIATGEPWFAGNGKRRYFTTSLLTELDESGRHVTIEDSRDRVYFYIDENLELVDREATVTLIYKENGAERKRRTFKLAQVHLLPVTYTEDPGRDGDGESHTIYMEQFEEYLDHYDPLDEHRTDQIYDGLPWAVAGTPLATGDIGTLYYPNRYIVYSSYNDSYNNYYDGWEYTSYVVNNVAPDQAEMELNDVPLSAFQYCHNKNKRNLQGKVPASYEDKYLILPPQNGIVEYLNQSKWFLPAITQMEEALMDYRSRYNDEFSNFYWSSSAAKEGIGPFENEDGDRARGTKVYEDGSTQDSDQKQENFYPNGGNALRTQVMRIRAFRIDLEPYEY